MRKRYWDDVLTSDPVNMVASRVASSGFKFKPTIKPSRGLVESDCPLPTERVRPFHADLTGLRCGRLTAIALSKKQKKGKKTKWVCRCDCGNFVIRSKDALRNPKNVSDACTPCKNLMYLKRADIKNRTGKWPDELDV
jgi:hypothetical protein